MSLLAAERFFSMLALVALAGVFGLVVLRLVPAGRPVLDDLGPAARWMAFAVAATATLGSLYFSGLQNLTPCRLCWYQRIAMYSSAVVLFVGALRRDRDVRWYALPLAGIGLVISGYHYLIEWFPNLETGTCDAFAPCSTPYFRGFGFVSLAFMASCGFIAIIALLTLTREPNSPGREGHHGNANDQG
ncbi:MAG: disulfide bond formation protein B [Ilumatobacteraceae bacterium]